MERVARRELRSLRRCRSNSDCGSKVARVRLKYWWWIESTKCPRKTDRERPAPLFTYNQPAKAKSKLSQPLDKTQSQQSKKIFHHPQHLHNSKLNANRHKSSPVENPR